MDFGNYETVAILGHGRFGDVLLVEDKSTGARLALKSIPRSLQHEDQRLLPEASILASLNHPCVIGIVGYSLPSSECEEVRMALEFASNGSIADALARCKKGDIPSFWTHENISCVIVGLVLGMKYLQSRDVIHRDLKPANLLLDKKC
jgi:serine/threonine protein kinase